MTEATGKQAPSIHRQAEFSDVAKPARKLPDSSNWRCFHCRKLLGVFGPHHENLVIQGGSDRWVKISGAATVETICRECGQQNKYVFKPVPEASRARAVVGNNSKEV